MQNIHLKKARLLKAYTQTQLAHELGISQPNYQRWESGQTEIPKSKLNKLAKILETSINQINGIREPFDLLGIEKGIAPNRQYFGEVAFHFVSGHAPLLLSITEEARSKLYQELSLGQSVLTVESLENQIVFIRKSAIADVFFSSEAYDDYGPDEYPRSIGIFPDDEFWEIIEHLDCIEMLEEKFSEEAIKEVTDAVFLSDENIATLISQGDMSAEERESVETDAKAITELFVNNAKNTVWQLSSGQRREIDTYENDTIYEAFSVFEFDDEIDLIYLPDAGYHRSIFINFNAVDYVSVPKHKYQAGKLESLAKDVDT
jgi:transcriptional regulator with XRE-family HTH domain